MQNLQLTTVKSNQSLQHLLFIKNSILNDIYENGGEILEEEGNELTRLDVSIPMKVDAWAWLLIKGGGIDKEVELLTDRKNEIDTVIQKLKSTKERLKTRANEILRRNGIEKIEGNNFWFKRDVSTTSRVIMCKVEDEFKQYELPKLSYFEYAAVLNAVEDKINSSENTDSRMELLKSRLMDERIESCGVKSLPSSHEAIETVAVPTLRIYKNR